MIRLSVITPTVGRLSLAATLSSVAAQLAPGDEHIVIGDGPQPRAYQACKGFGVRYITGPATGAWGNAQRDYASARATGDYLLFCDDDDVLFPGALDAVRNAARGYPLMFKMRSHEGYERWIERGKLEPCHVGGAMFVPPNDGTKLGKWAEGDGKLSDYAFIMSTMSHYDELDWREEYIIKCRS